MCAGHAGALGLSSLRFAVAAVRAAGGRARSRRRARLHGRRADQPLDGRLRAIPGPAVGAGETGGGGLSRGSPGAPEL